MFTGIRAVRADSTRRRYETRRPAAARLQLFPAVARHRPACRARGLRRSRPGPSRAPSSSGCRAATASALARARRKRQFHRFLAGEPSSSTPGASTANGTPSRAEQVRRDSAKSRPGIRRGGHGTQCLKNNDLRRDFFDTPAPLTIIPPPCRCRPGTAARRVGRREARRSSNANFRWPVLRACATVWRNRRGVAMDAAHVAPGSTTCRRALLAVTAEVVAGLPALPAADDVEGCARNRLWLCRRESDRCRPVTSCRRRPEAGRPGRAGRGRIAARAAAGSAACSGRDLPVAGNGVRRKNRRRRRCAGRSRD